MIDFTRLGGWQLDKKTYDKILEECGTLHDQAPWLIMTEGQAKGNIVLWDAYRKLVGSYPKYVPQTRGTCVGRAGARIADVLQALACVRESAQWAGHFSSEAVYALARVEIGKCKIVGDGAVVAYGVLGVHKYGFLRRGTYQVNGTTITIPPQDDDMLAVRWGSCRSGLPDELEPIAGQLQARQYAPITSYAEARDAILSGLPVWFGTSQAFWSGLPAKRDSKGFLYARGRTAHSWTAVGVRNDPPGILLDNMSWGPDWVTGPKGDIEIPDGCFWCTPEDFERVLRYGEAYAVSDISFSFVKQPKYLLL